MPPNQDYKHVPQRCAPDDPNRCEAVTASGQCQFLAIPARPGTSTSSAHTTSETSGQYCPIHAGSVQKTHRSSQLYQINRTEVLKRIQEFKDHPEGKTLIEEIGMVRLLLEKIINRCDTDADLVMQAPQITLLINNVRALTESNTKISEKIGSMLTIEEVAVIAQHLMDIVGEFVANESDLIAIADRFTQCLAEPPRAMRTIS